MHGLDLPRICPTCQVAWFGPAPCWVCDIPVHTTSEKPSIPNHAGPRPEAVGTPLNL